MARNESIQAERHPRSRRAHPHSGLPGRRPLKDALGRVVLAAVLMAAGMAGALWMARAYLTRDWSERVAEAKRPHGGGRAAAAKEEGGKGRATAGKMSAEILERLARAGWDRTGPGADANAWLACANSSKDPSAAARGHALALATGAREATVLAEAGMLDLRGGRPRRAFRKFRAALAASPGDGMALYGRALAEARLRMDAAALADVSAYLARNPHDAAALRLLAALLCQDGRADEALAWLERELARGGERRLGLDAAELCAKRGEAAGALRHLDAALSGGVPLVEVVQTYKGPLFDGIRAGDPGRAFTRRLAERGRALIDGAAEPPR